MNQGQNEQLLLVAVKGRLKTIGHCIGVVRSMIVDAFLIDGVGKTQITVNYSNLLQKSQ